MKPGASREGMLSALHEAALWFALAAALVVSALAHPGLGALTAGAGAAWLIIISLRLSRD